MLKIFDNPLLRQYAVVIIVNFSVLASGVGLVWPSPVLVKLSNSTQTILPQPITKEEGSWIVSIGSLTSIAANLLIVPFLVDRLGRKYSLILVCLPKILAGFVFIYASEVWMLLLGRALLGVGDAGIFTILPIYASEIASKEVRGSLGTILQIMCSIGVVIMLSMGPFVSYGTLNIVLTIIIILTSIPLFILPDSPYFSYSKGRKAETLKVLTFLRGSESIANEEMKEYEIAAERDNGSVSKKDIIKNKLFLKSLLLVVIMGFGAQFVGFNAVSFYLQTVLESTQTSVRPEIASVIIGLIQLFASFCTTLVTDRFGRKSILTVTGFGMALGMLGLGTFFKLKGEITTGFMNYVPLISLILVVYCYSAGIGSLLWVLNAELFDDRSRGLGMSIFLVTTTMFMFIITKYFAIVSAVIGPSTTYWIFSVICVLFSLFIMFFIPETKGKTFAEIQDILRKKKGTYNIISHNDNINWQSKELHGRYYRTLHGPDVDFLASVAWLRFGDLFGETEGFVCAIMDEVIMTNNYRKYIIKDGTVVICRACHCPGESLRHIVSGCSRLANGEYLHRHNQVARIIHQQLALKYKLVESEVPYYKYVPDPVLENDRVTLYWDRSITTDRTIVANKPDIVVIDRSERWTVIVDITIPHDENLVKAEKEKQIKYLDLAHEVVDMWEVDSAIIVPIVVTANGLIAKSLDQQLKRLSLGIWVKGFEKAVLLDTARIVRRCLSLEP